jgi:pantetheine-phosphate adenylyltransferase
MFDFVYIGIGPNPDKAGKQWFSRQENKTMIEFCLKAAGITNVKVICYDGLTVDCARNLGARVLLRGVRDYKDLKSELPLAWANLLLDPSIPTVFLVPYVYINVSSSYVKELLREDASVEELRRAISHNIIQPLLSRYEKRGGIYQPRDESLGFDGGARADMLENYFWPGRLRIPVSIQPQWWKAQIKRKGANNGYSGAVRSDGGVNAIKGSLFMLAGLMFQGVWGGTLFGAAVLFFISEDDIAEKAEEERPRLYLILVGAIIPLGLLSYVSGLDFPAGTFWGLAITCFDIAGRLHSQSQPQTAVAINLDGGNIKKTSSPVERMDGGGELPPLLASDQVIPSLRWGLGMWMLPKEMQELLRRPCEIKVNKITGSSAETLSTPAVELLRQKNRLANLGLLDLQTIYRAELDQNTSLILIPDQRDINLEGFLEIFMDRNTQKIIGYGLSHLCGGDLSLGMHFFKEYRLQHRAREIFPSRLAVVNSIFESNEYKLDRLIIPSRQINSPDALGSGALIFYLRFGFRPEGERLNNIAVRIIEGIVYNGEIIQVDILRLFSKKALSLPLENTKDGGHTEPARGRKRTGKDGGDDDKNILSRLRQISSRARNRTVKEFILRASPEVLILSGKVSEQALNVLIDLYGADLARFVKQDRYSNLYMAVNMWDAVFCENPGRRTAPLRWSSEYGKPLRSLARQAFDNDIPYFGENTASQRANFNARARAFLEQARKGGVIVYWHSDRKDFVYTVYDPDEKVSARVSLKLVIGIIAADIESYYTDSNAEYFEEACRKGSLFQIKAQDHYCGWFLYPKGLAYQTRKEAEKELKILIQEVFQKDCGIYSAAGQTLALRDLLFALYWHNVAQASIAAVSGAQESEDYSLSEEDVLSIELKESFQALREFAGARKLTLGALTLAVYRVMKGSQSYKPHFSGIIDVLNKNTRRILEEAGMAQEQLDKREPERAEEEKESDISYEERLRARHTLFRLGLPVGRETIQLALSPGAEGELNRRVKLLEKNDIIISTVSLQLVGDLKLLKDMMGVWRMFGIEPDCRNFTYMSRIGSVFEVIEMLFRENFPLTVHHLRVDLPIAILEDSLKKESKRSNQPSFVFESAALISKPHVATGGEKVVEEMLVRNGICGEGYGLPDGIIEESSEEKQISVSGIEVKKWSGLSWMRHYAIIVHLRTIEKSSEFENDFNPLLIAYLDKDWDRVKEILETHGSDTSLLDDIPSLQVEGICRSLHGLEKRNPRIHFTGTVYLKIPEIDLYIPEIIDFYNTHPGYIGYGFKRLVSVVVSKHNGTDSSGAQDGGDTRASLHNAGSVRYVSLGKKALREACFKDIFDEPSDSAFPAFQGAVNETRNLLSERMKEPLFDSEDIRERRNLTRALIYAVQKTGSDGAELSTFSALMAELSGLHKQYIKHIKLLRGKRYPMKYSDYIEEACARAGFSFSLEISAPGLAKSLEAGVIPVWLGFIMSIDRARNPITRKLSESAQHQVRRWRIDEITAKELDDLMRAEGIELPGNIKLSSRPDGGTKPEMREDGGRIDGIPFLAREVLSLLDLLDPLCVPGVKLVHEFESGHLRFRRLKLPAAGQLPGYPMRGLGLLKKVLINREI